MRPQLNPGIATTVKVRDSRRPSSQVAKDLLTTHTDAKSALMEPQFRIGDRVQLNSGGSIALIVDLAGVASGPTIA